MNEKEDGFRLGPLYGSDLHSEVARRDADSTTVRYTMFVGPEPTGPRIAYELLEAGFRLEAQDIPGLWRIDGGPELTTNQMLHVAQQLLAERPREG